MKTDPHFYYRNDILTVDGIRLDELASQYGTPLYVYSREALADHYHQYATACRAHQSDEISSLVC